MHSGADPHRSGSSVSDTSDTQRGSGTVVESPLRRRETAKARPQVRVGKQRSLNDRLENPYEVAKSEGAEMKSGSVKTGSFRHWNTEQQHFAQYFPLRSCFFKAIQVVW